MVCCFLVCGFCSALKIAFVEAKIGFFVIFARYRADKTHLSMSFEIRPSFEKTISLSPDEFVAKLCAEFKRNDRRCQGMATQNHVVLSLPPEKQHFWSPQLTLELEERDEGGTLVRGRYGPKPAVWTLFMFGYGLIGFAWMVLLILGMSEWMLDGATGKIWLSVLLLGLGVLLYLAAQAGKALSRDDMRELDDFIREALKH